MKPLSIYIESKHVNKASKASLGYLACLQSIHALFDFPIQLPNFVPTQFFRMSFSFQIYLVPAVWFC